MDKKNILYIIEELELGGAERVVIDQARALNCDRFTAKVCCLRKKGDFAHQLEKEGVEIIELHKNAGIDLSIIPKTMKVIKENNIDLIHTHLWVANFWGRIAGFLSGVPVVVTEHNVDVWKKWYHKLIDRMLAPFTKVICVVSNQVKKFYAENVGISSKKLQVVYNGIEVLPLVKDSKKNQEMKDELHIHNGSPIIVNIGRLAEAKANHIFMEALRILNIEGIKFHALVIGDGPLKDELMEKGKDLTEKNILQFTGMRQDVPKILEMADLSVLSSTREGFSIVVLETMAKGVPFVATRVGGNPEQIVDGETGYLVPVNDPQALAEGMRKIIKDQALKEKMGKAAYNRIKNYFSLEVMMKEYERIYTEVLSNEKKN